jgi:ubiquinone/menaquinone biosynthesis C-methylase UbiE
MDDGWEQSANSWIASMGEKGDWGLMLERVAARHYSRALDVGCGEGRFSRRLKAQGVSVVGIDPTQTLPNEARQRDPGGDYQLAKAEALPFADESFDLVVSYLTLIDIPDFRLAMKEMARFEA